ncbi:hypothetical protein ACNPN6_00475 [Enterobacter quasiroggenkampii]|uniref:hypothetical protein n=1 Tax=Enterobacter quasiroggenkampii TaxID=2497436 RepID=UPI003AADB429
MELGPLHRNINPASPLSASYTIEAAKAIGIHGTVSAHNFRKAGGNAIYKRSANNIALAMTVLNHSNITDTRRYLDVNKQAVSRVINEMDL